MSPKRIITEDEVQGVAKVPPRISKVLISEVTTGAQGISMGVALVAPGSRIPDHAHDNEEEAIYVVSGSGKVVFNGGVEEREVQAGSAIYAASGVRHEIVNTGDAELKLVWAYSPQPPEHRRR